MNRRRYHYYLYLPGPCCLEHGQLLICVFVGVFVSEAVVFGLWARYSSLNAKKEQAHTSKCAAESHLSVDLPTPMRLKTHAKRTASSTVYYYALPVAQHRRKLVS